MLQDRSDQTVPQADESDWDEDDVESAESVTVSETVAIELIVPPDCAGLRLDQALARLLPEYSRAQLQKWLRSGEIRVAGGVAAPRQRVLGSEPVSVHARAVLSERWLPEPMALSVVHEDADLIVVDKPADCVVHPGAGNLHGTLVNGLLHAFPELSQVPRAGLVHRLDKDTTGLLVVARSARAHTRLVEQLAVRSMGRDYLALVEGVPVGGFTVDAPIGRDPRQRLRMAVVPNGRPARTHVRIGERFRAHALLECSLESGRTHQIRVHLRAQGWPLLGDPLYGTRQRLSAAMDPMLAQALQGFRRQALHASLLRLKHPADGRAMSFRAPLPDDMAQLLALLRADREAQGDA